MTVTDVASVHESLVKLNQHTAARFDKTANTLIEVLDDQDCLPGVSWF